LERWASWMDNVLNFVVKAKFHTIHLLKGVVVICYRHVDKFNKDFFV
jgi:hypothetical protein